MQEVKIGDKMYQVIHTRGIQELEVDKIISTESNAGIGYVYILLCDDGCEIWVIEDKRKGGYKVIAVSYNNEFDEHCGFHDSLKDTNIYKDRRGALYEFYITKRDEASGVIKDLGNRIKRERDYIRTLEEALKDMEETL